MKLSDFLTGVKEVEVNGPKIITSFTIPGIDLTINLTETIVVGWIVMLVLLGRWIWARNLRRVIVQGG